MKKLPVVLLEAVLLFAVALQLVVGVVLLVSKQQQVEAELSGFVTEWSANCLVLTERLPEPGCCLSDVSKLVGRLWWPPVLYPSQFVGQGFGCSQLFGL